MPVDNGSLVVLKRGYRPPGGESTVQLTWSDNPEVPRSPVPVMRHNAIGDCHGMIMSSEESPVGRPTIRMHQVQPPNLRQFRILNILWKIKLQHFFSSYF